MKYLTVLLLLVVELFSFDAFVKPSELAKSFKEKNIIILDVAKKDLYEKSHIKGAIHVDVKSFVDEMSPYSLMKTDEDVKDALVELGINYDSHVVIYAHNTAEGTLNSSYLALVLISHGFENVSILDGGYMAWVFENELLTTAESSLADGDGNMKFKKDSNIIVNLEYVKSHLNSVKILDSRMSDYYYGTKRSANIKAVGHIPNAKSSSYLDKFLTDGTLREQKELDEIFLNGYDLSKDDEVIVYSSDVFSASMNWYILYKKMGFKNAKIYEASFLEWGNQENPDVVRFKWQ